ncbi:MAG TPA: hypothetical protein VF212_00260 [Longimicrobiales bacterium]
MNRRACWRGAWLMAVVMGVGCAPDRSTEPSVTGAAPEVARAIAESGATGLVAVARVMEPGGRSYVRVVGAEPPQASPRLQRASLRLDPVGTQRLVLPDLDPRFLLFITSPSGPNTFGAPNEVTVVWAFFCIDPFTGQEQQLFDVTVHDISNEARAGSGGHMSEHPLAEKPVGTWDPQSGHTAADGTFMTRYRSKAASGDEEVRLRYTAHDAGSPCADQPAEGLHFIGVRYPGLVPIEAVNGIYFDNITSDHNTVFFATGETVEATYRAALFYLLLTATDDEEGIEPLRVNAASLVFGGLNDVRHNWAPPHRTHRVGTDVDMDGKADSSGDNPRVWNKVKLAARAAGFPLCQVHDLNHVHCYHRIYQ